jgi:hypothetical protein
MKTLCLLALLSLTGCAAQLEAAYERNLEVNAEVSQRKLQWAADALKRGEITPAQYSATIMDALMMQTAADDAATAHMERIYAPGSAFNPIYVKPAQ